MNDINSTIGGTPKKETITTVLKVLSAVYLVMKIIKLGKELAKKEEKKSNKMIR